MLRVSMTWHRRRRIMATQAPKLTMAPTWMRALMSHHTIPSHHSSRLSLPQMIGLMPSEKLVRMIQRTREPAATFRCEQCQTRGAMQRSQENQARVEKRMAVG